MPSTSRILLVDDEARLLSGLRRRLVPEFDILTEVSATAALDLLDRTPDIAVVVVDMQMPEMTGIAFLRQVQERAPRVVRLMLTGNADLETAMAAINDGQVLRFLRKPCDTEELRAALHEALACHRSQSAAQASVPDDGGPDLRTGFLHRMNDGLWDALTEISDLAQQISPDGSNLDRDEMIAGLEDISHAGHRLADIARQVLDLKSLDGVEAAPEDLNAVALVRGVAGMVLAQARKDDVKIAVESLRNTIPARVCGPALRLALRSVLVRCAGGNGCAPDMTVTVRQLHETVQIHVSCKIDPASQIGGSGSDPTDWEMEHLGFALAGAVASLGGFGCRVSRAEGSLDAVFTVDRAASKG